MVATLTVAHEVRAIANPLMHEHHGHLAGAQILFIFTDQKRKRCDRVRLGSAGKLTALQRFLSSGLDSVEAGADFVVLIDENMWARLATPARLALVDHELCHCAVFIKDGKQWRRLADGEHTDEFEYWHYGIRGHDLEEFGEVLYRHGFWKPDALERRFGEIVAMQLKLTPDEVPVNGSAEPATSPRRRGTRSSESV